jgi:hypothetical protein
MTWAVSTVLFSSDFNGAPIDIFSVLVVVSSASQSASSSSLPVPWGTRVDWLLTGCC